MSARLFLSLGVLLLAPACGGQVSGGSGSSASGLYGTVFISPGDPGPCRQGHPCGRPAADYTLTFTNGDKVAARTKTDEQGRYRVGLPPGRYSVALPANRLVQSLAPPAATVPSGRYAKLDFSLDIGIR